MLGSRSLRKGGCGGVVFCLCRNVRGGDNPASGKGKAALGSAFLPAPTSALSRGWAGECSLHMCHPHGGEAAGLWMTLDNMPSLLSFLLSPSSPQTQHQGRGGGWKRVQRVSISLYCLFQIAQTTIKGFKFLGDIAADFRKLGYSRQLENEKKKGNKRFSQCLLSTVHCHDSAFPFFGWNEMRTGHLVVLELDILQGEANNSGQCRRGISLLLTDREQELLLRMFVLKLSNSIILKILSFNPHFNSFFTWGKTLNNSRCRK